MNEIIEQIKDAQKLIGQKVKWGFVSGVVTGVKLCVDGVGEGVSVCVEKEAKNKGFCVYLNAPPFSWPASQCRIKVSEVVINGRKARKEGNQILFGPNYLPIPFIKATHELFESNKTKCNVLGIRHGDLQITQDQIKDLVDCFDL